MSESTSGDVRAKAVRRILVTTVGVEALVVGGYAVVLLVDSLTRTSSQAGAGLVLALTFAVLCGGLVLAARAALRARRAARAPLIVWQILQAAAASDPRLLGLGWRVLLIASAVVAAVGVFWPGVLRDDAPSG